MTYNFLKLPEVKRRTAKGKSTIYREIKQGIFPRPIANGRGSVAWLETEIAKWQEEKIAESRGDSKGQSR